MTKRVRVVISGSVQGVGFRWYCREQALSRNVTGSVRNRPDGRVEAAFEGEGGAVDAVVAWCRTGPRGAEVSNVEVVEETPAGTKDFEITRS
ncbi:MAG: acylphosphatase [Actinobacteria bacterium]|nr:acylphosphatase [Actinomycetota bacterium]